MIELQPREYSYRIIISVTFQFRGRKHSWELASVECMGAPAPGRERKTRWAKVQLRWHGASKAVYADAEHMKKALTLAQEFSVLLMSFVAGGDDLPGF